MVLAAITSDFELRTEPNDGAGVFGDGYGLFDLVSVAIEVHGPLVEIASGHLQQPHPQELGRTDTESGKKDERGFRI